MYGLTRPAFAWKTTVPYNGSPFRVQNWTRVLQSGVVEEGKAARGVIVTEVDTVVVFVEELPAKGLALAKANIKAKINIM